MSALAANVTDDIATEEAELHFLPASISFDGSAAVSAYFKPREIGAPADDSSFSRIVEFRGRQLAGTSMELAYGYLAAVVTKRAEEIDSEQEWKSLQTFHKLSSWDLDAAPLNTDKIKRSKQWLGIAAQVGTKLMQ